MSRAVAVFHGQFGRATVYQLNRPFTVHAHREGHLIFHLGGSDGSVDVDGKSCPLSGEAIVAVNPWEPHNFIPSDVDAGALFFVLYIDADWFATGGGGATLCFGSSLIARTPSLDRQVRQAAEMVRAGERLGELDRELREPDRRLLRRLLARRRWPVDATRARGRHRLPGAQVDPSAAGPGRRGHRARRRRARIWALSAAFLQALPHSDRSDAEPLSQYDSDGARARKACEQ